MMHASKMLPSVDGTLLKNNPVSSGRGSTLSKKGWLSNSTSPESEIPSVVEHPDRHQPSVVARRR